MRYVALAHPERRKYPGSFLSVSGRFGWGADFLALDKGSIILLGVRHLEPALLIKQLPLSV